MFSLTSLTRFHLAAMRARGFAAADVLSGSGLSDALPSDLDHAVTPAQAARVVLNMLRITGEPDLGLELGRLASPADFGASMLAQLTAHDLREALDLIASNGRVIGQPSWIEIRQGDEGSFDILFRLPADGRVPVLRFRAEETVVAIATAIRMLAGSAVVLDRCHFSYTAPRYRSRYPIALGCPVYFGSPNTTLRVRRPSLDWPLPGHQPEIHAVCLRHLADAAQGSNRGRRLYARLRNLLYEHGAPLPTIDQCAERLGMSARSLRRHLANEQYGFQMLVDEVRLDLARVYLLAERRSVKSVAAELGYRDISAFRRAFKGWTGMTVRDFVERGEPPPTLFSQEAA